MGACLSKKRLSSNGVAVVAPGTTVKPTQLLRTGAENELQWRNGSQEKGEKDLGEENSIVIRHRKSYDKSSDQEPPPQKTPVTIPVDEESQRITSDTAPPLISGDIGRIRTSSCTKEEVDAILIQCGRLSRSSSGKAAASRKYSGSKRSFDFDHSDREALADDVNNDLVENKEDADIPERQHRHRQRNRQSPRPSPSRERRRTLSRERDQSNQRERRVSRSPGRRSSEPFGSSAGDNNFDSVGNNGGSSRKPVKMVSVPATEKSNNCGETASATTIKKISVKRNTGEAAVRVASSPRSQSPARTITTGKASDENLQQNQQPSLSRSSSRKEQSPYRRTPLSEIDQNTINGLNQKSNIKVVIQGSKSKMTSTKNNPVEKTVGGSITTMAEETKVQPCPPEAEILTKSRSAKRSPDLEINPETLLNPNPSYTTLLLEDIQNFHQKNTIPFPPCLTKACSILEAVADLNSTTSSEDRTNPLPFTESEVAIHGYVTVTRGGGIVDMEDQESSGSNSFIGNQQNLGISSSWEPNSADSTDTTSKSVNSKDEGRRQRNNGRTKESMSKRESYPS